MIHQPFHCHKDVKAWAAFLKKLRSFFDTKGFYEVSTPHLVPYGAFESSIDPLKVSFSSGKGELHTSPEIQMKGLMSESPLPIYQICKCFRDDPDSPIHAIEFTMLEYYRINGGYQQIQNDLIELVQTLNPTPLRFQTLSLPQYLMDLLQLDLTKYGTRDLLREFITQNNIIAVSKDDTWEDLFFKLLIEKVEPSLDPNVPTLITDYPPSISPLSKRNPETGIAERFEIYWKGMELCNGCVELTDLNQLKQNYNEESTRRKNMGKEPHPVPEMLYTSAAKLKNLAGVAIGLERLFLCVH